MDLQPIINLIAQTGIWCVAAFAIGKILFDWAKRIFEYIKQDKEQDRQDFKEEKDRIYSIMEQQRELLARMVTSTEHNQEMLEKLTNIQILHTNRLDKIEEEQSKLKESQIRLEEEVKKIGSKLQ